MRRVAKADMASVSSTSNASQYGVQQLQLQQARRNADQAELNAEALKGQATDAQRVATQAEQNAQSLGVQSGQAQAVADQTRRGVAALNTQQQSVTQLGKIADQVLASQQGPKAASTSTTTVKSPAPVVNTQGQVTGKIVNTTA